jgi:peptide deformylase
MLSLVKTPDNFLKKQLPDFDFDNPIVDPLTLEEEMVKLMLEENGIGLAANQVGIDARVFVMQPKNIPDVFTPFALFNPKLITESQEQQESEEGCLSFPNLFLHVKRPYHVVAEFLDRDKNTCIIRFDGIDARCFLHELDHLNGVCFTNGISKLKLDLAIKKQRKLNGRTQQRITTSV